MVKDPWVSMEECADAVDHRIEMRLSNSCRVCLLPNQSL